MSFVYIHYMPLCIVLFLILCVYLNKREKKFFEWIKTYWNFKRSWTARISFLFFIIAIFFMIFSLLDLRGIPEKIESRVTDQKTIILIDNSASMLVQDVRPNRFERAIMLARHFVKKSAGHQISLILFSDTHKRLLPFTDDLDLLDARLAGLKGLNLRTGGSGIIQAIAESINYFRHDNPTDKENIIGNILLFTDAEEHNNRPNFTMPEGINLAIVAVGTQSGGKIPLRNKNGVFMGYKKHQGREVFSKLTESNIKALGKGFKNFKHWIALSYNIPTEDILSFFRNSFKQQLSNRMTTIQPVFMHYLVITSIVFYILYAIFFNMPSFSFLILLFLAVNIKGVEEEKGFNQSIDEEQKKILMEKFKEGSASIAEKGQLAKDYLDNGEYEKSKYIYEDIIENNTEKNLAHLFNYATALLYSGDVSSAMELYSQLSSKSSNTIKEKIQNNIGHFFAQQQQQQQNNQNNQKENKQQQQNDKKEKNKTSEDSENEEDKNKENNTNNDQQKRSQSSDKKERKLSEKKEKPNNNDEENKDEDESEKKQNQLNANSSLQQNVEEREKDIQEKRKLTKIPVLLKKLMQDDRGLQEKFLDTRTQDRQYSKDKKDW